MAGRARAQLGMEPLDGPLIVQALAAEYPLTRQPPLLFPLDSDIGDAVHGGGAIDVDELDLLLGLEPVDANTLNETDVICINTGSDGIDTGAKLREQPCGDAVTLVAKGDGDDDDNRLSNDSYPCPLQADSSGKSSSLAADENATTQDSQQEEQMTIGKIHPRRNRKRRKHEVDALRIEENELTEKLEQLQTQVQQSARASSQQQRGGQLKVQLRLPIKQDDYLTTWPSQLSLLKSNNKPAAAPADSSSSSSGIWESLAWFQREEVRASMEENTRLRALYRDQLLLLKHLDTMAPNHFFPTNETPAWLQDQLQVGGASALATKRARRDPFDDDFAIFASLGRDFDAQYLKTDAILKSAGLANFDGRRRDEMVPTRGANGIYFLESIYSKMIPRDVHAHDETIWNVLSSEQLHAHHGAYEVRELTHDVVFRKIVNKIRMPHEETTLIRRTALKRYIEADRVVVVWDAVLEVTGSISMRLRERGWKVLRRPHVHPETYDGVRPLSVEQLCIRITPELCSTYAEEDIAAGSLTNAVVSSYRQHLLMMHHLDKDAFAVHFKKAVETLMSRLNS